jgi:hypothetical protein
MLLAERAASHGEVRGVRSLQIWRVAWPNLPFVRLVARGKLTFDERVVLHFVDTPSFSQIDTMSLRYEPVHKRPEDTTWRNEGWMVRAVRVAADTKRLLLHASYLFLTRVR